MNKFHIVIVGAALLLGGCAHQIVITPDLQSIDRSRVQPVDKTVGYYISPQDRELKVTTPGGGGDKVTYYPYKDLEPALEKVLYNVFKNVKPVAAPNDAAANKRDGVAFVFVPVIRTTSLSHSAFTWPPTDFTVELRCTALDADGNKAWERTITGVGHAEFDEFKSDFPLAGKRAAQKAFADLQAAINGAPEFHK